MYNEGISREGGCSTSASPPACLTKTGAWFNYGDIRLGQGRENARDFLKQNPEIAQKIDDEIRWQGREHRGRVEGISEAE
jgi:recombination protein RecA